MWTTSRVFLLASVRVHGASLTPHEQYCGGGVLFLDSRLKNGTNDKKATLQERYALIHGVC